METLEGKICAKCLIQRPISLFHKRLDSKDGLRSECKICTEQRQKKYREDNSGKIQEHGRKWCENNKNKISADKKRYYEDNKDKVVEYKKKYREENKDKMTGYLKEYYKQNKGRLKIVNKNYRHKNKDKIRQKVNIRLKDDVQFRLSTLLRQRLSAAIQGGYKAGSAVRDLGCSIDFLKAHLELQFDFGMTWDNWGKGMGKWNIDHIVPISSFDLTDRQNILLACHYGNLQPLWFEDNSRKWDNVPTWENYKTIHLGNKIAA